MKIRLYTYFDTLPALDIEEQYRLVRLWRNHHAQLGYDPISLNQWHARQVKDFRSLATRFSALPTINPAGYDLACYYRWLAMARVGGGIMMDYDCFLYLKPQELFDVFTLLPRDKLTVHEGHVPSMVSGSGEQFLAQAEVFAAYTPTPTDLAEGRPHVSDMTILAALPDTHNQVGFVKLVGEAGWQQAPAVHYSNGAMTPKNFTPRSKHIPLLRKVEP